MPASNADKKREALLSGDPNDGSAPIDSPKKSSVDVSKNWTWECVRN